MAVPRDVFAAFGSFPALAFADLADTFLAVELAVEDFVIFFCDFLDIRLPFVAFGRTMSKYIVVGAADSAIRKVA